MKISNEQSKASIKIEGPTPLMMLTIVEWKMQVPGLTEIWHEYYKNPPWPWEGKKGIIKSIRLYYNSVELATEIYQNLKSIEDENLKTTLYTTVKQRKTKQNGNQGYSLLI